MPRPALVLLLLSAGLLLLTPAAHGNDQDIGEAPSVVAPPFDSTGSGNENESSKDGSEQTKTTTAASEPGLAAPSKYPIYGPFIASRDVVLLEEGPAPGMVVNPEDRDKAGRNRYEYVPTGLEGWYENGYGSNYHSAYPYPPDPYLADSQYYPDYGWDQFHEWPYGYVSRKDATVMGPGDDDRTGSLENGEEGTVRTEVLAAKEEANTAHKERDDDGSDKQFGGGGYNGGGDYPYGGGYGGGYPGGYGGGYGYPTYYTAGIGGYFRKGRKGAGFYANFGGYPGGYGGYGGGYPGGYYGGGGYPGGGGNHRRRLRGPGAAGV